MQYGFDPLEELSKYFRVNRGNVWREAWMGEEHLADKGGSDEVNALLNTEDQVLLVLLSDGRKIDLSAGEVDALFRV